MERCRCRDCCAGDALPDRLQGWPGAWQAMLFPTAARIPAMPTHPTFDDPKLRAACTERCAEHGDPPCFDVMANPPPCGECLRDCGIEPGDEFDENAAIARLL